MLLIEVDLMFLGMGFLIFLVFITFLYFIVFLVILVVLVILVLGGILVFPVLIAN